jgi:translation initiation factor 2 beta subunit (eIF-2beta)/eIF-5
MEKDDTRATDYGVPWYECKDCGNKDTADTLDIEESTMKCGLCGNSNWIWI